MKLCRVKPVVISRLVDGDLAAAKARIVRAHLSVCGRCSRLHEQYVNQRVLLDACFSGRPISAAIMARIDSGWFKRLWLLPVFRYGFAGSLAAVCMTVALLLYHGGPGTRMRPAALPDMVLESVAPATMLHPLSALVYYEEMAGSAVHSQFVRLTPQVAVDKAVTDAQYLQAAYHESQLFYDNVAGARLVVEMYSDNDGQ